VAKAFFYSRPNNCSCRSPNFSLAMPLNPSKNALPETVWQCQVKTGLLLLPVNRTLTEYYGLERSGPCCKINNLIFVNGPPFCLNERNLGRKVNSFSLRNLREDLERSGPGCKTNKLSFVNGPAFCLNERNLFAKFALGLGNKWARL